MIPVHLGYPRKVLGSGAISATGSVDRGRLAMEALALIDLTDSTALFRALEAPVMF